ncbi:MAG: FkbM family methyltransferase [Myxococcota bacterium]
MGAHVGNRVTAWRSLGARVVAVEPQPLFARYLRNWVADEEVEVLECALSNHPGNAALYTSSTNPTVSTLSVEWKEQVARDPGFEKVDWDGQSAVEVRTLDQLIERFGIPDFCKIDVEGAERAVLEGTRIALPALSFEALPAARGDALEVLGLLSARGDYRFNWSPSESMTLAWDEAGDAITAQNFLQTFEGASGDIYAWLAD